MNIIGKLSTEGFTQLVVKCSGGYYHRVWCFMGSGCFSCEHEKGYTYFDYLNVSVLPEITDEEIINNIVD